MHNSNKGVKDMATRRISASLDEELVRKIDHARGEIPRSAYIRILLRKLVK
jgi:metal-responsive CopG/Arc/MetJ family transcriptional regulator